MSQMVTTEGAVDACLPDKKFLEDQQRIWTDAAGVPGASRFYHRRLAEIYRFLIPAGQRVLELGCGPGHLLAAVQPSYGVGVDFCGKAIEMARRRYPDLHFVSANIDDLVLDEQFDFIILSDVVNYLWDVQHSLERCHLFCRSRTRLVLNVYSRLWQPFLGLARTLGLARKVPEHSWITPEDLKNFLHLADFGVLRCWGEILWPIPTPLVSRFMNRYLVKMAPFRLAALTNFVVARPLPTPTPSDRSPSVSVIVPARNEVGNIQQILERAPNMGGTTEIFFVEGGSTDDTFETIQRCIADQPTRRLRLLRQTGRGKGDAVRLGFCEAEGNILMILDADLTVSPNRLSFFYEALVSGKGEFINGVRLVYPLEDVAMRFFNVIGNKFFGFAFSYLLGQSLKDSLCGTKVLWKEDYERIAANRSYFGDFDPFGDFDLIFGAAKLNLKIVDLPVRYRRRTYGTTNIQRWKHGWMLLKMVLFAARRIKFV